MATTRLMAIHAGGGRSVSDVIDYVENPEKTQHGELISSFECDSRTADAEFLFSKRRYSNLTGRDQGGRDIIAYHLRQSFRPGEISAEEANEIGRELASRFTKGNHAFIVATHIDKAHIHNHIIFNSTALDCKRKFRNFLRAAFAVRRISDRLCVEHGLSIVEKPKPSRGSYGTWLGDDKPLSFQERLRLSIDEVLEKRPADLDAFLTAMEAAGFDIKRGKHLAFKAPGQGKFTRCRESTLGADYTEQAILDRIAGQRAAPPRRDPIPARQQHRLNTDHKVGLLIDIQSKIQQGKGAGYQQWATVFNLKEAAKTLVYLQEHGIGDYDALAKKTAVATARFNTLTDRMKELEVALATNAALQKHIVSYSKTRSVYAEYRASGYSKNFRALHEADIILHQASKRAFDEMGFGKEKKLPRIAELRADYSEQLAEKKRLYSEHKQARSDMRELLTAKANADRILGLPDVPTEPERALGRGVEGQSL